ncbi:uncharacterized protein LOC120666095 [Panicum virgatum]|uniref:F-box domain-containing protein n=1 Tax=Panicum virgatum TaxID=38727 RepID=A0A8T0UCZ6_PANVG|nr:uncharacterized protein LOC120666095 [Panicum virgatum]XP_039801815.1 uncharacterized protein LOC120666095 [Panicum virgatum]XP_039801816.1 uncharacterized protein LOC120666095 [Panicum virgatum]XP_039801817.1 uncharacterized protein LOC120666095 [Panicum virgatum]KAG2620550.1 hypothetical protein PVAP13_3NG213700 [Panicum virgatum]
MATSSPPPPPPKRPQAPVSGTTIRSLGDDLLLEIFLRLPSLPSLVRAALTCRSFLAAVRSAPAFRRRFAALRPPPLLGLFFDYDGVDMPSFRPVRRSSDPDLAAAARGADVFLTRVPGHDDASPGWQIAECRGGSLLLLNQSTEQMAVYNPLSRALDLFPTPPDELSDGCRGKCIYMDPFLLSPDGIPGPFRVVAVCHDKSRLRAAVFSSGTRAWQILPWSQPAPAQPSGKKYWLLHGRQVNGKLYWSHAKRAYMVVLDTTTLQFSFIDLPEHLKGKGHLYMAGETKDGRPCIVSTADFTLSIWFRRADADGVEMWMLDSVILLEEEVLRATNGSLDDHGDLKVLAILDGIVYLSTFETFIDATIPCWYLFFCLETRKLEKIFHKKDDGHEHPYIMAWPNFLVSNNGSPSFEGAC